MTNNTNTITTHSLDRYSMSALLDFKTSLRNCTDCLAKYRTKWRNERKQKNIRAGRHGGVTPTHQAVVESLLRILPKGMDWIKTNRIGVFRRCKKDFLYAVMTTSSTIINNMFNRSDWDNSIERIDIGRSTLFNALNTLQAAGIIKERKTVRNPEYGNKRSMLIYLDASVIAIHAIRDTLPEAAEHKTDEKQNGGEVHEPATGSADSEVQNLDYYNTYIQSINNKNNTKKDVDKVSSVDDLPKKEAEMVQSKGYRYGKKMNTHDILPASLINSYRADGGPPLELWKTCERLIYSHERFDLSTTTEAIALLEGHFVGVKAQIQNHRGQLIHEFCKSDRYLSKKEKEKTAFLKWFINKRLYSPLRDVENCAMMVILEAMRIFHDGAMQHKFKPYHPKAFLREDYGLAKQIQWVINDLIKESRTKIIEKSDIVRLKTTLRGYVATFASTACKNISIAVNNADHYIEKAKIEISRVENMSKETKHWYYGYFKTTIKKILEGHGKV